MILKANSITELELQVVDALKNGWACQGGIFALSPMFYCQAMVK